MKNIENIESEKSLKELMNGFLLDKINYYQPECHLCKDKGHVKLSYCDCSIGKNDRLKHLVMSGMPKLYREINPRNLEYEVPQDVQNLQTRYIEEFTETESIFIGGRSSTSKTMTASLIFRWLLKNYGYKFVNNGYCQRRFIFINYLVIVGVIREFNHEERIKIEKSVENADVLLIDDFASDYKDTDRGHSGARDFFQLILNRRIGENLPTIITGNYDLKYMNKVSGLARTSQRIMELVKLNHVFTSSEESIRAKMAGIGD